MVLIGDHGAHSSGRGSAQGDEGGECQMARGAGSSAPRPGSPPTGSALVNGSYVLDEAARTHRGLAGRGTIGELPLSL
jgi:hypothetical protein